MKKFLASVMAVAMAFALCAGSALAAPTEAGFEEFPIGTEQDVGVLHVAAVYFQPVKMEPADQAGLTVEQSNLHIECDVHALENDLGYGVGDWIPYMTVNYAITDEKTGKIVLEGDFMPMSASDGPHYGANIMLKDAGTYTLTFTFHSPAENGYLLHVDKETGVNGRFWKEPIVVTFKGWQYVPQEW